MLANYINLKRHWEISTCYENSPIKELVKNNNNKKSKDKKELQEIINVSSYYMDNTDFNTIKHFLIHWYQTKIKHYEEELNTSFYCRGKSQIL